MGKPDIKKMKAERDVEGLINALKNEDKGIRRKAAEALDNMGDARAVEPLIQALKDNDLEVREKAADALGDIGDTRAVKPLIEALVGAKAKYEEGGPPVAQALLTIAGGLEVTALRSSVIQALEKIGGARAAVEPLIQALKKDEDSDVRYNAAWSLGYIGDARAVEPLTEALKDESWWVREGVKGALKMLKGKKKK